MNYQYKLGHSYLRKLIFPVIWQAMFIMSCIVLPRNDYIYTNFLFYLGIIVYFIAVGDFKYNEMIKSIKSGKKFWIAVLVTSLGMAVAFYLSNVMSLIFPNCNDGMIQLNRDSWFKLIIFSISTIVFPPLAEELFYRQAFIRFDNKIILFSSAVIGMILYALEHSLTLLGIVEIMIIAVPLTISYIKTKNIYITITAHFIVNLIGNGITVIVTALSFIK